MKKIFTKLVLLLVLAGLLGLNTGCRKKGVMNPYKKRTFNLLGAVQTNPYSYQPVTPVTIPISYKDVLFNRENFGGREVSLLWGLITITDY